MTPISLCIVAEATSESVIRASPKSRILIAGVAQPAQRLGLALEKPEVQLVDVLPAADHLQCDAATRLALLRLVDDAHSAFAELAQDPVIADRLPDGRRLAPLACWRRGAHGPRRVHAGCGLRRLLGREGRRFVVPVRRILIAHADYLSSAAALATPCAAGLSTKTPPGRPAKGL
jgi:hypothetical protein